MVWDRDETGFDALNKYGNPLELSEEEFAGGTPEQVALRWWDGTFRGETKINLKEASSRVRYAAEQQLGLVIPKDGTVTKDEYVKAKANDEYEQRLLFHPTASGITNVKSYYFKRLLP